MRTKKWLCKLKDFTNYYIKSVQNHTYNKNSKNYKTGIENTLTVID